MCAFRLLVNALSVFNSLASTQIVDGVRSIIKHLYSVRGLDVLDVIDHTVVHFEIPADDVEKLRKFYSRLFGWKIEKTPGPTEYWTIETVPVDEKWTPIRPGVNGGMMKRQNPMHKPINYVAVESADEYSKKIEALGGKVIVPKREVPGVGWWALALDPEGNQFAILESV